MSEPIIIAIVISVPPTIAAVIGLWKMQKIAGAIYNIHVELNGRLTEWIENVKVSSHAAGMKEQKDSLNTRTSNQH